MSAAPAPPSKRMSFTKTAGSATRPTVAPGAIFGLGNPLLDISAKVPKPFLEKYGLTLNNAILADPAKHANLYSDMEANFKVDYIAGGATQNAIRVAQWMLAFSPGATTFVGSVGDAGEARAVALANAAGRDGVRTLYYHAPGHATGTCAVLVHDTERSLVANLAAANELALAHMSTPDVQQAISNAQIYYSAGFILTVPTGPDAAKIVATHAVEHDKIYTINLAAPFICQFFTQQLMALMPYTDYVFGNESEAKAFAEAMGWASDSMAEVALRISSLPKQNGSRGRIAVITQGSDPTIVAVNGVATLYPVPLLKHEQIVDTNGAGDAFVGGFLSQLALQRDLEACVRAGQYASRVILQRDGCTFPAAHDYV